MSAHWYCTEEWAGSSNKLNNLKKQIIIVAQQHNAREQVTYRILIVSYNLSNMENINNNACFIVFPFDILSLYLQRLKRML